MNRISGVLVFLILLLLPAAATAHQGNPNFRSEINSIQPERLAEGLTVETYNFDDGVRLINDTGEEVVVIGYDGEPYFRISPEGVVEVNLNSPSYYLNEDRLADVEVPDRADPEARPEWEEVDNSGQFTWHDHRSHYMGSGNPPQVEDESVETKVFDYTIPLTVGGESVKANGTLTWVGPDDRFPILPFIGLAVVALIGGIFFWRRRRQQDEGEPEEESVKEAW